MKTLSSLHCTPLNTRKAEPDEPVAEVASLEVAVDSQAVRLISAALGRTHATDISASDAAVLMALAADRLEKASFVFAQLTELHLAAQRVGFTGHSATKMLKFVSEKLDTNSAVALTKTTPIQPTQATQATQPAPSSQSVALSAIALACVQIDPALAFHEAYPGGDPIALHRACLRVIGEGAGRIEALRTTLEILLTPTKMPNQDDPRRSITLPSTATTPGSGSDS